MGETLWVGRTHLSWAGGEHLAQIEMKGVVPFDPLEVKIIPNGFQVRFTKPVGENVIDPTVWNISRYTYAYHVKYGSPELDKEVVVPQKVVVGADGKTVDVILPEVRENVVYDFDMKLVKSKAGESLLNGKVAYTVRKRISAASGANVSP